MALRNKEFWRNVSDEELAEIREEVDADMERVEEFDAEEIREVASRKLSSYSYSIHCPNCQFKFRVRMDMGVLCKVCGDTVYR